MRTVCGNICTGCYACNDICPKSAITVEDKISEFVAVIDENKCIDCNLCTKMCPNQNIKEFQKPQKWFQGWAKDEIIRNRASSGGIASAIANSCIEQGFYVCSCVFTKGEFIFLCTNKLSEIERFAGSKYVKSNPQGIYKEINILLKRGQRVLFIGLPCQCAAVKNYITNDLLDRLYTVDLICHGTPSKRLLDIATAECGLNIEGLDEFRFRTGTSFTISCDADVAKTIKLNMYLLGFLKGDYYSECCYNCLYARYERVSDITLGDSWGTELTDELNKGISLILVQTSKGKELLQNSSIILKSVDINNAVSSNGQLRNATMKSSKVEQFYRKIEKTNSFFKSFFLIEKRIYLKQTLKVFLNKLDIYKPGMRAK